jgi:hypothetical protein
MSGFQLAQFHKKAKLYYRQLNNCPAKAGRLGETPVTSLSEITGVSAD